MPRNGRIRTVPQKYSGSDDAGHPEPEKGFGRHGPAQTGRIPHVRPGTEVRLGKTENDTRRCFPRSREADGHPRNYADHARLMFDLVTLAFQAT